ncbi:MAG TPA: EAL domain-containing protein [Kineosporiaceae bacterium]|nr:EAL domain-containing protein [Kineosporiaceae bacterium]
MAWVAVGSASAACALGVVALVAWLRRWTVVLGAGPNSWPIVFNAALGLALTGAALAGMGLGRRRLAPVAAGYDLAVGSLTLVEHVTGHDFGIDQLFIKGYISGPAGLPGRVSPNASLCLVLLGVGILASSPWRPRPRTRWLALSGVVVTAIGVVALFGYAAGLPDAYDWSRVSGMSLVAACGMTLLGTAALALGWAEDRETVARTQWWALPAGLLALAVDAFVWEALVATNRQPGGLQVRWVRATTFLGILLGVVLAAAVWLSRRADTAARARRRAEQALAASEERFRLAFDDSCVGMALLTVGPEPPVTDPASRCLGQIRVNQALRTFLGRSPTDLSGLHLGDVLLPEDLPDTTKAFQDLRSGDLATYQVEHQFRHASGGIVWGALTASMVHNGSGAPLYMLFQVEDITDRKRAEEQLVHRALHDDLTGLPNRSLLLEHLTGALNRARRTGSQVGVLFLDLDDFKSINDSFGHGAGDQFLTRVAAWISASVRASDLAARVGGDEFVVVCEDLKEPADTALVADQIQRALAGEVSLHGQSVTAGASIGIALSHPGSTPESLLRDADAAMYEAKSRGGRCWQPAGAGLQAAALRVLTVQSELRHALKHQELRVYYQPVIDLKTGAVVAVEALLRWQHPERGLILPEDFLDIAEQRGLIHEIGDWVLRTACAQAATWYQRYGDTAPTLAVNISSRQLNQHDISEQVLKALQACHLPPERLFLEITESQLLIAGRSSTDALHALAGRGVRIAVDDFGTGYASFDYLRRLPVHQLKIDKSFINEVPTDRTHAAITAAVITLGHNLGLTVVAEGIETAEQLHALQDMDCPRGQGWLWHHALPATDLDTLLAAHTHHGLTHTPAVKPPPGLRNPRPRATSDAGTLPVGLGKDQQRQDG